MKEFELTTEAGPLSATLNAPDNAHCGLVLAHGAGADHKHAHMESLSAAFSDVGIATLRFNFPFKQKGGSRVDSADDSIACIVAAASEIQMQLELPLFIGGHSFGGRMATHAVAKNLVDCNGVVLCSFPLHTAGKPSVKRVDHFKDINTPMVFLSGDRDALADPVLLEAEVKKLGAKNQLHWLATADHSFKILKRKRDPMLDVYKEAATHAAKFTSALV